MKRGMWMVIYLGKPLVLIGGAELLPFLSAEIEIMSYAPTVFNTTSITGAIGTGYMYTSLTRTAIDASAQVAVNGIKKWDTFDSFATGFTLPGFSSSIGGAVDYIPFSNGPVFRVVCYNKDLDAALLDANLKHLFSGSGIVGSQTSRISGSIKNFSPSLVPIVNAPFSLGGKLISKEVKSSLLHE